MAIKSVISLKDNFTAVMRTAKRETSSFAKEIQSTKKSIERLQNQKKEIRIQAKIHAFEKNIGIVKTRLDSLKKSFVVRVKTKLEGNKIFNKLRQNPKAMIIKTKFQDSKIIQKIKSVEDRFKKLGVKKTITIAMAYKEIGKNKLKNAKSKTQMIFIKAKDMTAPIFSKVKSGLASLGRKAGQALAIGITAGIGASFWMGINGAMNLEQQKVSMEHFIGIQNKGMSKEQVGQTSNEYIKWLRNNANKTPFETGEVIGAGARAVNVAGGNVDQAKGLVQLAENMAALNPGKSVMDAMEALADLRLGEAERMKEFGFKLSAEDFTGGKGQMSDMSPEQLGKAYANIVNTKLNPFFEGGAEKIAQTRKGQISTIVGVGKSILTDVTSKMLEKDGGSLGKMGDYMSNNAEKIVTKITSVMENMFSKIETGWGYILTGFTLLKPYLMPIANLFKVGFGDRISFIKNQLEQWKPTIVEVWGMLTNVFTKLWPVVSNLFNNVGGLAKTIITTISPIVQQIISTLVTIVNTYVVPIIGFIGNMISGTLGFIKGTINVIGPLFSGLAIGAFKALQGIIDFLAGVFTGNWRKAWDGVLNIFSGIWNVIKGAVESIGNALSLLPGFKKDTKVNVTKKVNTISTGTPYTPYTGGTTKWTGHAVGLNRVPRDNYPAMLHQGERVLTAQEVRQGKGESGNINLEMLISRIVALLGKTSKEVRVEIAKIADSIVIREEADIYKIANAIAEKLEGVQINLT